MNFFGKSALVTGGAGLIGSAVTRKLIAAGCRVTIIDNLSSEGGGNLKNIEDFSSEVEFIHGDIRDKEKTKELLKKKDFLFHMAAQTSHVGSMREPFVDIDTNVTATVSILEAVRIVSPEIEIVNLSTRQVYGAPNYFPVDDNHPVNPPDVNAINKIASEQYFSLYKRIYGIRSTSLRLTNIYGPGMRIKDAVQNFLGVWIKQLLNDEQLKIFGNGQQIRDFVFVEDCADLILKVAINQSLSSDIYLVGGGRPVSLIDLAEMLIKNAGSGSYKLVPFPPERSAIDIGDFYGANDRVCRVFDWQPETSLEDGIRITLSYFRRFLEKYL